MCTSIGALCDQRLLTRLTSAAIEGNAQLQLASGSMPGIDWMSASAIAQHEWE